MIFTTTIKVVIILFSLLPMNIFSNISSYNDISSSTASNLTITTDPKNYLNIESLKETSHVFEEIYKNYASSLISKKDFICLEELWEKESNWNPFAENKNSGAYGIPQSLPGSKMASKGDDWRINYKTQIDWGLDYINKRYGNSCKALTHHGLKGWY